MSGPGDIWEEFMKGAFIIIAVALFYSVANAQQAPAGGARQGGAAPGARQGGAAAPAGGRATRPVWRR